MWALILQKCLFLIFHWFHLFPLKKSNQLCQKNNKKWVSLSKGIALSNLE